MFDTLSERLSGILDRLTRRGALSAADVDAAAREVRRALLEGDVALEVVTAFIAKLKERAVGVDVIKSVTPGQMVVKIVHDELVETLGTSAQPIDLNAPAPRQAVENSRQSFRQRVEHLFFSLRVAKRRNIQNSFAPEGASRCRALASGLSGRWADQGRQLLSERAETRRIKGLGQHPSGLTYRIRNLTFDRSI
jgi:hypothetical protein